MMVHVQAHRKRDQLHLYDHIYKVNEKKYNASNYVIRTAKIISVLDGGMLVVRYTGKWKKFGLIYLPDTMVLPKSNPKR